MELKPRPTRLNIVTGDMLLEMNAGDGILLDESDTLRPAVESVFIAVLSCPCCGTLGMITNLQYCGMGPVNCAADDCSCRFQIVEKTRFAFLPAN
jgi:hypothetical protein